MVPSFARTPITSTIAYYAVFFLVYLVCVICIAGLMKALYPNLPTTFWTMPWLFIARIPTALICQHLGIYPPKETKGLEFVAPEVTTPTEVEFRDKPFPWPILLLIAISLFMFQGWDIVTRTNMHPALLVFIVMLLAVAGIVGFKQRGGHTSFTRADATGLTYSRWLESPQTLSWSQIASVERVETFDGASNQKQVFWEVRDKNGQSLLIIWPYAASLEQQEQFSRVVSRYLVGSA